MAIDGHGEGDKKNHHSLAEPPCTIKTCVPAEIFLIELPLPSPISILIM